MVHITVHTPLPLRAAPAPFAHRIHRTYDNDEKNHEEICPENRAVDPCGTAASRPANTSVIWPVTGTTVKPSMSGADHADRPARSHEEGRDHR